MCASLNPTASHALLCCRWGCVWGAASACPTHTTQTHAVHLASEPRSMPLSPYVCCRWGCGWGAASACPTSWPPPRKWLRAWRPQVRCLATFGRCLVVLCWHTRGPRMWRGRGDRRRAACAVHWRWGWAAGALRCCFAVHWRRGWAAGALCHCFAEPGLQALLPFKPDLQAVSHSFLVLQPWWSTWPASTACSCRC